MSEEFREFDKAPILPVVRINRWSFGLREVILAIIAGILLVMCLIFAGFFGSAKEQLANAPSASALVDQSYCTNVGCLKTAVRAVSLMNKSVHPCENFYQFACGNYKNVRRVVPNQGRRNVFSDLSRVNEDRIIDIMEQPISASHEYSAEGKLKKFFRSCNDMYAREKQRGLPVLKTVLPALGGWKVLGTWDPTTWDINTALKKVQSDFWVDALYGPRVAHNYHDGEGKIISIFAAGTGKYMDPYWYVHDFAKKEQDDYKKFIRRVGQLLVRDAATLLDPPLGNSSITEDLLDEFVNDTYTMEFQIANLDYNSDFDSEYDTYYQMLSLSELTSKTNNMIDWTAQLSYLFKQNQITSSTEVEVSNMGFFTGLGAFLESLPEADRKRILHNYFIWRVAESYVQEMSWEYIHANREIFVDLHKFQDFSGLYRYCFYLAQTNMMDALNHLYITQFLSKENKDTAHEITDNIRQALKTHISKTPWMDAPTRKKALQKLGLIKLKIGYPDWIANQAEVDGMYGSLMVNESDFFGNLLNMNQFQRKFWNDELKTTGSGHEEWTQAVYATTTYFSWAYNEVAATAGILQFPIYDYEQPHFSSFGSLGAIMGSFVHRFVDDRGKNYDKEGQLIFTKDSKIGTWWSNSTETKYKPVKQCVRDAYSNLTRKVQGYDGHVTTVKINASYAASNAINWVSGVRLALLGYQDWVKNKSLNEKMIPGLHMPQDQMIFLAHAQTYCEVPSRWHPYWLRNPKYLPMDTELTVNMALGQLTEFSQAFQCKKTDKMNHAKKCQYY